jgi:hypothetical protein
MLLLSNLSSRRWLSSHIWLQDGEQMHMSSIRRMHFEGFYAFFSPSPGPVAYHFLT